MGPEIKTENAEESAAADDATATVTDESKKAADVVTPAKDSEVTEAKEVAADGATAKPATTGAAVKTAAKAAAEKTPSKAAVNTKTKAADKAARRRRQRRFRRF